MTTTAASHVAPNTGGDRGIGCATALSLARDGVDMMITYRSHADEAAVIYEEEFA